MKKVFSILSVLFCAVTIQAQTSARLVVWQKSGEKVYFDLAEQPRTTFEGSLLVIRTSTAETSYQRANVLRYTYEGVATGIDAVEAPKDMTVGQTADGAMLRNVPEGTAVKLYDAQGILLETQTSDGHSPIAFSFAQLPQGVYIVNVNEQSFKFWKR